MATPRKINPERIKFSNYQNLKYLNAETFKQMTVFAGNIAFIKTDINKLNTHPVLGYYENGWS
ncbi:MAG: hypothetical protein GY750_05655 [Lentisphaerae bacterium]|nr:hypothetical protein [Lentisphaerota bacterium]MCP4100894.1 hypothetical protein [Lentisphaerota bacterium]